MAKNMIKAIFRLSLTACALLLIFYAIGKVYYDDYTKATFYLVCALLMLQRDNA